MRQRALAVGVTVLGLSGCVDLGEPQAFDGAGSERRAPEGPSYIRAGWCSYKGMPLSTRLVVLDNGSDADGPVLNCDQISEDTTESELEAAAVVFDVSSHNPRRGTWTTGRQDSEERLNFGFVREKGAERAIEAVELDVVHIDGALSSGSYRILLDNGEVLGDAFTGIPLCRTPIGCD